MTALEILTCGPATSIQDGGRPGWSRIGLPAAGAMDLRALHLANALVGNAADEAAIELALAGMTTRVRGGAIHAAVVGADAMIAIDGRRCDANVSFVIEDGETLSIGAMRAGVYAMLAVEGGFAISPAMGSRALDLRAGIGGWQGRALRAGDAIPLRFATPPLARLSRAPAVPLDAEAPIRIVLGPQDDAFTEHGLQTLLGRAFEVSHRISRMAYRLDGPTIERRPDLEMISEGTLPGSIQVPPDGHPLVLMADRQTVGGYPKIATVISADLGRLAQRRPGQSVSFQAVSAVEAREIARQMYLTAPTVQRVGSVANHAVTIDPSRLVSVSDAVVDAAEIGTWEFATASRRSA